MPTSPVPARVDAATKQALVSCIIRSDWAMAHVSSLSSCP